MTGSEVSRDVDENAQDDARIRAAIGYRRIMVRRVILIAALGLLALGAILLDLGTGPSDIGVEGVLRALLYPELSSRTDVTIVWEVRLPQAAMAILVGGALALAGAEMQTLLGNPMASPFTLGISSAAAFGAALAIALGIGVPGIPQNWILSGNAFVFALGSVLLLQVMARVRGATVDSLVLCGIALFFTFNALVALVQFLASQQALQQLVFWIMGSLARANWDKVALLATVSAVCLPFSFYSAWALTALRLGEDRARAAGVDIARLRFASLLRISLLTATSMAFVGTIGFIGLAGPHIARLLTGEDHRFFLPASVLTGMALLSLASVASKVLIPGVLIPIGIVTALLGLPVFFSLILSRRSLE